MKKVSYLFLLCFVNFISIAYAQDINVSVNDKEVITKEECPFSINGICITEDVGGVDLSFVDDSEANYAKFTNYNSKMVTVVYDISIDGDTKTRGTIVLDSIGTQGSIKLIELQKYYTSGGYMHTIDIRRYGNKGLIVRFLK